MLLLPGLLEDLMRDCVAADVIPALDLADVSQQVRSVSSVNGQKVRRRFLKLCGPSEGAA